MTDTPDDHLNDKITEARWQRSTAASALVAGSTSLETLLTYRRWVAVSRLLGDISEEDADASVGRAQAIFSANTSRAVLQLPPHLEPQSDTRG